MWYLSDPDYHLHRSVSRVSLPFLKRHYLLYPAPQTQNYTDLSNARIRPELWGIEEDMKLWKKVMLKYNIYAVLHWPSCHILTDLTVMPRALPSPQVGSQVEFAIQKSCMAVLELSTHGLSPTPSLR